MKKLIQFKELIKSFMQDKFDFVPGIKKALTSPFLAKSFEEDNIRFVQWIWYVGGYTLSLSLDEYRFYPELKPVVMVNDGEEFYCRGMKLKVYYTQLCGIFDSSTFDMVAEFCPPFVYGVLDNIPLEFSDENQLCQKPTKTKVQMKRLWREGDTLRYVACYETGGLCNPNTYLGISLGNDAKGYPNTWGIYKFFVKESYFSGIKLTGIGKEELFAPEISEERLADYLKFFGPGSDCSINECKKFKIEVLDIGWDENGYPILKLC